MKTHDNSLEMWNDYYTKQRSPWFEKIIHLARKLYFGGSFARTINKLSEGASSFLEIGVGSAQTLEQLQLMTSTLCTGLEKTPVAHALGEQHAKHCQIILGDGLEIPFPDKSFDVVYSLGLFEHFELDEQLTFLREQARVAKKLVIIEVPVCSPHMRAIMWFNRRVRGLKGVWADDELFSQRHFTRKFPELPFLYHFGWASLGMTCWFVLDPDKIRAFWAKLNR